MNTSSYERLDARLKPGHLYRREVLAPFSKALDRDLMSLIKTKQIEKVAPGIYYKPATSRLGATPPNDKALVRCFLKDDEFLLFSWNQYNMLGVGLTQLYTNYVVYNHKRHGIFELDRRKFHFYQPTRGFPSRLTIEFLLVDLVNNLSELAEDACFIKQQIKNQITKFNRKKLSTLVKKYGKVSTKRFFQECGY